MSSSDGVSLDLREFLRLAACEIDAALLGIDEGNDRTPRVTSVRLRLEGAGRSGKDGQAVAGDPLLEQAGPWQLEVLMGAGDRPSAGSAPEQIRSLRVVSAGLNRFPGPFGEFAVETIQGVGKRRGAALRAAGILTLWELANARADTLSAKKRTIAVSRFIELRVKAALACSPVPALLPSPLDEMSLRECALASPRRLSSLAGGAVPAMRCDRLSAYLGILLTTLDDTILRDRTVRWLRETNLAMLAERLPLERL